MMATSKIPRVFSFIFGLKPQTEPFHLIHYLCLESCLQVNKPEKILFYYHYLPYGRYWDMISEKLQLVKVDLVDEILKYNYKDKFIKKYFTYAHHSDFLRIQNLNETGGVYADIDTLFIQELPQKFYNYSYLMGHEGLPPDPNTGIVRPSVCNAFIMAEKNSYFGLKYIEEMPKAFDGAWSSHSCDLAWILSQKYPEHIHLEPQDSFYKHTCTTEGIEKLLIGTDPDLNGVYSFHLWAHLWWSKKRKDFTRFHAGKVNEDYIRKVDTTYNLAARKYLPPKHKRFWFFDYSLFSSMY